MRHFVWLFVGLLPIGGVVSVLDASETPGWRPKTGVVSKPLAVPCVTGDDAKFDWRDDLYGSAAEEKDRVQNKEVDQAKKDWGSCPTCKQCGKYEPVQANYAGISKQINLLDGIKGPNNSRMSAVQKRVRLAVQPKTRRR